MNTICEFKSSLGWFRLEIQDKALSSLEYIGEKPPYVEQPKDPLSFNVIKQIEEYLKGERKDFSLPLSPKGTEFQKSVWKELRKIPYGQTASYKQIAVKVGGANKSRAVGMANNKNPILLIIPCHRVIASDGSLSGFALGVDMKRHLLRLESVGEL